MRTGLPKSSVAPRRANITTPRCQSRAAAPRPRERSRHPHITAHIVAERRHSAITRYAQCSAVCRVLTRPCCRRAGGTPLLQSRSLTARAVTSSVNPRQRRGHTHRRTCAAERRRWHSPASPRPGGGGGIIEKKLCESKYCCNFVVMKSVCTPWSAIKRERRANRRQYPLL